MDVTTIIQKIVGLDTHKKVRFIILYGSLAQGTATPLSDIDLAVCYEGSDKERFTFRIKVLGELPDNIDLHVFQDVPLLVQNEIIAGKVLYYTDFQFLFDQCMKTIKEFNTFEKYYNEYFMVLRREVEAA